MEIMWADVFGLRLGFKHDTGTLERQHANLEFSMDCGGETEGFCGQ